MVAFIDSNSVPSFASRTRPRVQGPTFATSQRPLLQRTSLESFASHSQVLQGKSKPSARRLHRADHSNQQFSILALTDSSGSVVERVAYQAYGQPTFTNAAGTTLSSSAKATRYSYTGREWDASLELFSYRERVFSPPIGRFLERDPATYRDGLSLYESYFRLSGLDPMGLAVLDADPANPSGMAWCNMGGEYDSAKNTLGYTEPTDYCVNCRCICCDPNNHCNDEAKIACRVHIRLKVYVYKTHLDTAPERTRRLFGDISRIYGHEQLHVRNLLAIAQVIKDSLTKLESTYGCQNVRDCAINATRIEANAKQLLHQDVWGEGHKPRTPRVRPSPLPEENTPYDPMGGVFPRTSDCTKPNTVNPFDPGKECRTRE